MNTVDRAAALGTLKVDDICHAECPNGASLICLVESITDLTIQARRLPNHTAVTFDRRTGLSPENCSIDSIAPLPEEIRGVLLALEHRYRTGVGRERFALNPAEKHALVFVDSFYAENPL